MSKPVLLVDDDSNSATMVESMLDFLGVTADLAENGRVAVAKAAAGDYAAILMDIEMPEMDGLEATRAIRAHDSGAPIIAMTGHTTTGMRVLCEKAGMTGVLLKPFGVDALKDKLVEICGAELDLGAG